MYTDLIGEYIAQGASSVVLSDAIFDKDAIAQRNFGAVSQLAQFAALVGTKAVERCVFVNTGACHTLLLVVYYIILDFS